MDIRVYRVTAMLRQADFRFGDDQVIEHSYISMGARGVVAGGVVD
jgi:hypothetical protein